MSGYAREYVKRLKNAYSMISMLRKKYKLGEPINCDLLSMYFTSIIPKSHTERIVRYSMRELLCGVDLEIARIVFKKDQWKLLLFDDLLAVVELDGFKIEYISDMSGKRYYVSQI